MAGASVTQPSRSNTVGSPRRQVVGLRSVTQLLGFEAAGHHRERRGCGSGAVDREGGSIFESARAEGRGWLSRPTI
jgi:hypothetical protein